MNEVQPIKNKRDIERMKQCLHGRDLLLFIVGINTNLRISDILTLTREQFDCDHLSLKEQKTGKSKKVRINENVKKAINELAPQSGYLFASRKGDGPITRTQAWRILNAGAKRAGLNIAFGTHTLRKTWAYHAYNEGKGADLALVTKALNHSSQRETLRYIGIEQDNLDDLYLGVNL